MRDRSIDALRGLAITLVIAGHALTLSAATTHGGPGLVQLDMIHWVPLATAISPILSLFYSFHMPLFAFVSGLTLWLSRGKAPRDQIVRRASGLLVPYFAWFVVVFFVARDTVPLPPEGFGPALIDAAMGRGGLWYLYALFISAAVVVCLGGTGRHYRFLLVVSALIAIASSSGLLFAVPNVMYLSSVLWIHPFVVLGYMLEPLRPQILKHRWRIVATSSIAFLPLFCLRYPLFVPSLAPATRLPAIVERLVEQMHAAGIRGGYVLALLPPYVVLWLPYVCASAAVLALYAAYAGREGPVIGAQAWLGRKSLGIYALHGPFVWWLAQAGIRNWVILALVSLGVSVLAAALLERIPVLSPVLLGQRAARRGGSKVTAPSA